MDWYSCGSIHSYSFPVASVIGPAAWAAAMADCCCCGVSVAQLLPPAHHPLPYCTWKGREGLPGLAGVGPGEVDTG